MHKCMLTVVKGLNIITFVYIACIIIVYTYRTARFTYEHLQVATTLYSILYMHNIIVAFLRVEIFDI